MSSFSTIVLDVEEYCLLDSQAVVARSHLQKKKKKRKLPTDGSQYVNMKLCIGIFILSHRTGMITVPDDP